MTGNEIPTGFLSQEGYTPGKPLKRDAVMACPYVIMMPEHYRDDGSCRCDDPSHTEMLEWEYVWDGERWVSDAN